MTVSQHANSPARTPDVFSKDFEIFPLERFGQRKSMHASDRLQNFEVLWVQHGGGTLQADLGTHALTHGTVYLLTPGQYRHLKFNENIKGYYMTFSNSFLSLAGHQLDLSGLGSQNPSDRKLATIATSDEIEDILPKIYKEYNNYFLLRSELLRGLVKVFVLYLTRQADDAGEPSSETAPGKHSELVKRFLDLLKTNFATKKSVSDYAEELCVTPNYLNSIVKKMSGFTASYHIQQYIVLEAKRQALYSELRMKEIAYYLGFEDYTHFSKFFKNNTGMTFSDFKRVAQQSRYA